MKGETGRVLIRVIRIRGEAREFYTAKYTNMGHKRKNGKYIRSDENKRGGEREKGVKRKIEKAGTNEMKTDAHGSLDEDTETRPFMGQNKESLTNSQSPGNSFSLSA